MKHIENRFGKPLTTENVYDKNRLTYQELGDYGDLIEEFKIFLADLRSQGNKLAIKRTQLGRSILYEGIYSKLQKEDFVTITEEVATLLCLYAGFEGVEDFVKSEPFLTHFFTGDPPIEKPYAEPPLSPSGINKSPQFTTVLTIPDVDFTGRKFLLKEVDYFLNSSENGYFLIEGDPGIGKTSFAKKLILDRGYPHHLNIRVEGINSPADFLFNICGQLLGKYYEYKFIRSLKWEANVTFFKQLLENLSRNHSRVVMLVDALDETMPSKNISENPIQLPKSLPQGVFIIATTRRTPQNLLTAPDTNQSTFPLLAGSDDNLQDIQDYLKKKIKEIEVKKFIESLGITETAFMEALMNKSEGNFMYLSYFFSDLKRQKLSSIENLPLGLTNYYEDHWNLMKQSTKVNWEGVALPILASMVKTKQSMLISEIQEMTQIESAYEVGHFLHEWEQFFHTALAFGKNQYRFYHASFLDFLSQKEILRI